MVRTQISLTDDQMRRLRAESQRRDMPIAAIVREAVDRAVPADPARHQARLRRAVSTIGRFDSGTGDVAAHHDEIAGESTW
jgi:hypothetical protein